MPVRAVKGLKISTPISWWCDPQSESETLQPLQVLSSTQAVSNLKFEISDMACRDQAGLMVTHRYACPKAFHLRRGPIRSHRHNLWPYDDAPHSRKSRRRLSITSSIPQSEASGNFQPGLPGCNCFHRHLMGEGTQRSSVNEGRIQAH